MKKMSGDMKGFLIFLSIVFAIIMFICFPKWGCGIFFPRYNYIFLPSENEIFYGKNFKNKQFFTNELNITLGDFSMFSNDCSIWVSVFADKPYSVLHIKQLSCCYQGRETVLYNDIDVELPETIKKVDRIKSSSCGGFKTWATDGPRRYITSFDTNMPVFKAGKILKHKKIGEEFPFQLRIRYSFDGGEERICNLHYNVKVIRRDLPIFLPME